LPRSSPSHATFLFYGDRSPRDLHSFPTRRSSDLQSEAGRQGRPERQHPFDVTRVRRHHSGHGSTHGLAVSTGALHELQEPVFARSEEHTSELQSRENLVCRLLLEKKKKTKKRQEI